MKQILLNSAKNNTNVNVEVSDYISLSTKQRSVPMEKAEVMINHYELYLQERNECKDYKMCFTLHPFMSNVLINAFTEVVYNEGAINSGIIKPYGGISPSHKELFSTNITNSKTKDALFGEGIFLNDNNEDGIDRRYQLLRDSEYTHSSLGGLTYHCGIDAFNNHYLRSTGLFRVKGAKNGINKQVFNTIEDFLVYSNGTVGKIYREAVGDWDLQVNGNMVQRLSTSIKNISENPYDPKDGYKEIDAHMFSRENTLNVLDSFSERIKEDNGWIGFYNRAYLPEQNTTNGPIINKFLNNEDACAFVDMYPDRSLFSFLPKINLSYGAREEYNWKWFLTYPFKNVYNDENGETFDFFGKNGLKITWSSSSELLVKNGKTYTNLLADNDKNNVMRDSRFVYFRTKCKHNLKANDIVRFKCNDSDFSLRVLGVGDIEQKNKGYYFFVSYDDLADEFGELSIEVKDELNSYGEKGVSVFYVSVPKDIYVSKLIDGVPCQYYIRQFKKMKQPHSVLNKMAFSNTIFNDKVSQILYDENVNLSGLKDNLGRDISEVFITFVKNNKGNEKYYFSGITTPVSIEFSHCFGRVTSGFNFECGENEISVIKPYSPIRNNEEYFQKHNVRSLYNLENFEGININNFCDVMGIRFTPPSSIENNITENSDVFYGDFVEFSPSTVTETVIEDVYHRFNTMQRESNLNNDFFRFDRFRYDEIVYDDYDFNMETSKIAATKDEIPEFKVEINNGGFRGELIKDGTIKDEDLIRDNIFPEGYFYKPHYRVKLKEYSKLVTYDYDVPIVEKNEIDIQEYGKFRCYSFKTKEKYAFSNEDRVVLYYEDGHKIEYYVYPNNESDNIVTFYDFDRDINEIREGLVRIFYKNAAIPNYAYYTGDGTGKYIWRQLINDTELDQDSDIYDRMYANGAVYINTNINFYLRRQDPYGNYGLQYISNSAGDASKFKVKGVDNEVFDADYITEENYSICEI